MKQTHHIGYVQTPSVKNLSNVKNALVENGLVPLTTPNEMLPDAIEKGLKALEIHDYGMIHEGKYRIRYFDIDGTILKIEYVAEGGKLTPPTKTPNYDPDYLIFDEWNYDIENYVVEQPTDVGATYKTVDDATYMLCRFSNATGLNPTLAISGFTSIDWGDGTVDTSTSHTYSKEGNYIIKIYGNFSLTANICSLPLALYKIYFKDGITQITETIIGRSLQIISLPKSLITFSSPFVSDGYSLNTLILPKQMTKLSWQLLPSSSLNYLVIGQNCLQTGQSCLKDNKSLKSLILSPNMQKLNDSDFNGCSSCKELVIPKTIIQVNGLQNLYAATDILILSNNIPTLNISTFSSLNRNAIFWVKDAKIEGLKVATNWSKYASQMKPLSWYPSLTDPNAE